MSEPMHPVAGKAPHSEFQKRFKRMSRKKSRSNRRRVKLAFDILEDRITPTTFIVDTFVDEFDINNENPNNRDLIDATDDFTSTGLSLREAIWLAENTTGGGFKGETTGDTIEFDPFLLGTFNPDGLVNTVRLTLGELTKNPAGFTFLTNTPIPGRALTDDLVIDGSMGSTNVNDFVVVSGDFGQLNDFADNVRIISLSNAGQSEDITFKNLVFSNGYARDAGATLSAGNDGGAVHIDDSGDVFFIDVLFRKNFANRHGGAVYKQHAGNLGEVTFFDTTLSDNEADKDLNNDGGGGALYINGGFALFEEINNGVGFTDVLVDGNIADEGGAVWHENGTVIFEEGTVVDGNGNLTTQRGGGFALFGGPTYDPPGAPPPFTRNLFLNFPFPSPNNPVRVTGNRADIGGGMYLSDTLVAISHSSISNNQALGDDADQGGGGIYADFVVDLLIEDTDFLGNTANAADDGDADTDALGKGGAMFAKVQQVFLNPFPPHKFLPNISITRGEMRNNLAHFGGAIHFEGTNNIDPLADAILFLDTASIDANIATFDGGGIHTSGEGEVEVFTPQVQNNIAGERGGGFFNSDDVFLHVLGDTFLPPRANAVKANKANGTAEDQGGGGLFNEGPATALFDFVDIFENTAPNGEANGAGIHNTSGGLVTLTNQTWVFDNIAVNKGGGAYNLGTLNVNPGIIIGDPELPPVNFIDEANEARLGAGVFNGTGGDTNVDGAFVQYNTASESGGGIYNDAGGFVDVVGDSLIDNNIANGDVDGQGGGGIFNQGVLFTEETTISNNEAEGGTTGAGGGVYNTLGGLATFNKTTIIGNIAEFGGGFRNDSLTTVATFFDSLVRSNTANQRGGGGDVTGGSVSLNRDTIQFNVAIEDGGGLANVSNGEIANLTVKNAVFLKNLAQRRGGGVFNDKGITQFTASTLTLNEAKGTTVGDGGGGVFNNGTMFFTDSAIHANYAPNANASGGGILNTQDGTFNLIRGSVSKNSAGKDGGGASNDGGVFNINNAHLVGNEAGKKGGGLHLKGDGSTLTLEDGSFRGNSAEEGGGVWTEGTLNLDNVNLKDNTATEKGGAGIYSSGGTVNLNGGTVVGNEATGTNGAGGGIYNDGGTVVATNTSITNNSANKFGGGIEDDNGTLTNLTNVALDNNIAGKELPNQLSPGEVVIIGYRSDDIDGTADNGNDFSFAWVPLRDLKPNQVIFFTDDGVKNDGDFRGQEGAIKYTAPATGLAAGNVMLLEWSGGAGSPGNYTFLTDDLGTYSAANDAEVGTNGLRLDDTGDNLFVFDGTTAAPNFIFGLKTADTFFNTTSTANDETALPAALTQNTNAVALGDDPDVDFDNGRYKGLITGTQAATSTRVSTRANWDRIDSLPIFPPDDNDLTNGKDKFTVDGLPDVDGGGLHITGASTVTITGGSVSNNTSQDQGGGLYNSASGSLTLTDVNVNGNTSGLGGGIFQSGGVNSSLVINSSLIEGNITNENGGGLLNNGGNVTINISTISGNKVTEGGGGIANIDGDLNVNSATVAFNDALVEGGGLHQVGGVVNSGSSIWSNNTAGLNPDISGTIVGDFNLVSDDTGATITGNETIVNVDPALEPLDDNGGPTQTHALTRGSAAIDSGKDAAGLGKDQRGETRPFDSGGQAPPGGDLSDRGAFESQIPPFLLVGLQGTDTLVTFSDILPGNAQQVAVIGLMPGENLIALDSRAEDENLYGITDMSNIYLLNSVTGQATFVSSMTVGLNDGIAPTLDENRNFYYSNAGVYENLLGQNEKWILGEDIEASGNRWYTISPRGDVHKYGAAAGLGLKIASLGANVYHDPSKLIDAFDGFGGLAAGDKTAFENTDETHRLYRASSGDFYYNLLGQQEKWLKGAVANKWYVLRVDPGDNLKAQLLDYNGASLNTSTVLATLDRLAYDNPKDLYTAFDNKVSLPGGEENDAKQLDIDNDFYFVPNGNLYENLTGLNEKYFLGDATAGNGFSWYYVTPDGKVWRDDNAGGGGADTEIDDFDDDIWDAMDRLLVNADDPYAGLPVATQDAFAKIDFERGLFRTSDPFPYYYNFLGAQEKWLRGNFNSFGNPWYIIDTNNDLFAYNGSGTVGGTLIANVDAEGYQNPQVLFEAYNRRADLGTLQFDINVDSAGADFDNSTGQAIDFLNPTSSLRLVIDDATDTASANFQIDLASGLTELDSGLENGKFLPDIAFSSNVPNAAANELFTIDFTTDRLFKMNRETGVTTLVGNLNGGVDFLDGGIEIIQAENQDNALAVMQVDNGGQIESRLYFIDLTTGQATAADFNIGLIGALGVFDDIHDLALSEAGWALLP